MASPKNIKTDLYTTGSEFLLDNSDYVGFFNVRNNIAYTGRTFANTSQQLEINKNVRSSFYISNHQFDRFITDVIVLPYSFEDIAIGANDLVTSEVINVSFDRLFDNFVFLYSRAFIASNIIPEGYQGWYGLSAGDTSLKWQTTNLASSAVQPASAIGFSEFDNVKNAIYVRNQDNDKFIGFLVSDTNLIVTENEADLSVTSILLTTDKTFDDSDVEFVNISDLALDIDNFRLYIADAGTNSIFKYDIEGFLVNNQAKVNKRFLKKSVGGKGGFSDKTKFDNPSVLSFFNEELYVYDSNNNCVKVFDKYLNYRRTIRKNVFQTSNVVDLNVNKVHDLIYALTDEKRIIVYDLSFENPDTFDYTQYLNSTENILKVEFSNNDSNIGYILTDENIYKFLLNKIGKGPIGRFQLIANNISGEVFKDLDILNDDESTVDKILAVGTSKILLFEETSNFETVLGLDDFTIYLEDEIFIENDEYTQAWVYNKEIHKLLVDIYKFRNNVLGRFVGKYNSENEIIFDGFRYLTDEELSNIFSAPGPDFFVHMNEDPTPAIINRVLRKIYDLEDELRNLINGRILNSFPIDGQPVVIS